MKTTKQKVAVALSIALCSASIAFADSGEQYRRSAIMNANQVKTVFGNWGVIGQPAALGDRGAWRNDNDGYLGDVSLFVGAEVNWNGSKFHTVATCPVDRPTQRKDQDPSGNKYWTFEPVDGYFNANGQKVAVSTDPTTWPDAWPDKFLDPNDPGWRGEWNGYFGKKTSADQETYFVMDDQNDERFNVPANNPFGIAFKPDATNLSRNGMGLVVTVRALQWAQFLAKDNIFWIYEIHNTGTTTYNKMVFGMLVGTYVGVTSTEDYQEYNDDWSFYEPTQNITYTGDYKAINGLPMKNPLWVGGTGLVGYAFLESPGNPFDGIDNDGDADLAPAGLGAPKFTTADFDSLLLTTGMNIVLINDDFTRTVHKIVNPDSELVYTRGLTRWIYPGKTKVVEGNQLFDTQGNPYVNENAYDGVDNNFNGLIDENYRIHYRQVKANPKDPQNPLFDILRPLRHKDYVTGAGTSPYSMIDEARNDLIDNNLNWDVRYDDVGRDGVANTHDFGEGDGIPTSGYDANYNDTGLPGEPHIDKTDVKESDQIVLTSFSYFAPSNQIVLGDKESLWQRLLPGFFDVPASISHGKPTSGEDGDFVYGSGYFHLLAKGTERFSIALVYGGGILGNEGYSADTTDLLKNKKTVQKIYDANYQFPQPPDKPTLTAVPGDHQVTLYWDRKSESSVDPVLLTKNFEGYRLYKSTDPNFSDIFTITDGSGQAQGYRWLGNWDLADGITGYFQANSEQYQAAYGYTYFLGNDNGLVHSYVDKDVNNGQRYFYALVAYSKGDAFTGIFPAENTKFVSIAPSGAIVHDVNVVVVTPNAKVSGYVTPPTGTPLTPISRFGTGTVTYQSLDPAKISGHKYRVEFWDTEVDSVTPAGNPVHSLDSTTWERLTKSYSVRDESTIAEGFTSLDTLITTLKHRNIIPSTVVVTNQQGSVIPPASYRLNPVLGTIRGINAGDLPKGSDSIRYQYYPVLRSPNILLSPFAPETQDADIFDGVQLSFQNQWTTVLDGLKSRWTKTNAYTYTFSPLFTSITGPPDLTFKGFRKPSDYAIIFSNAIVDTTYFDENLYPFAVPVKFRIYNQTDSTFIKFIFADNDGNNVLSKGDEFVFVEKAPDGKYHYTWDMTFDKRGKVDSVYQLGTGDTLLLRTQKPFRYGDVLEFTAVPPAIAPATPLSARADLARVKVVPNPYVTASQFELPLNPGITSGRGQRRIDFIHMPAGSTVKIFTARGDYVVTLYQDANIEDGSVSWNLKSYENLDVAYGVYFYVVESPVGNTTGKIAIIK